MKISVTGSRVIITAGARGIGRAIVDLFAEDGAVVSVCDVDADAIATLRRDHPGVQAEVADVSDPAAVEAFFAGAVAKMGGLDALINNAGISGPTQRIEDISEETWERTMRINVD